MKDKIEDMMKDMHKLMADKVEHNNKVIGAQQGLAVGDAILQDNGTGMMVMLMCEFLTTKPLAKIENAKLISADDNGMATVEVVIPFAYFFDAYITRRFELASLGISSMKDQTIEVKTPVEHIHELD